MSHIAELTEWVQDEPGDGCHRYITWSRVRGGIRLGVFYRPAAETIAFACEGTDAEQLAKEALEGIARGHGWPREQYGAAHAAAKAAGLGGLAPAPTIRQRWRSRSKKRH